MSRPPIRTAGRLLVVVVCLLLCAAGVGVAAQGATIQGVSFSGGGVVGTDQGVTFLAGWQSQQLAVELDASEGNYEVCAQVGSGPNAADLGCRTVTATAGAQTVTFTLAEWPTNATGQQTLSVSVSNGSGAPLDTVTRQLHVLPAGGDFDDDGLGNQDERQRGTNIRVTDTDGDGLSDGREVNQLGTNATRTDTDGDGLGDGVELSTDDGYETSPTEPDTDGDGLSDGAEQTSYGTDPTAKDTDGDGLEDGVEVSGTNSFETDPNKADSDGDGLSDGQEVNVYGTDPTTTDTDSDGLTDSQEIHGETGYETNASNADTDADTLSDGAEVNEYGTDPTTKDTDEDGVNDAEEIEAGTDPSEGRVPPGSGGLQLDDAALVGGLLALYALVIGAVIWVGRSRTDTGEDESMGHGGDDDGPPAGGATTDQPSPMTNEDRVRQMLDESGGRLKQSDIVAQTDWSKSKVSRLLSKMESDGEIRKISIGRENLITRPGDEPESARPPFEEQGGG
ncbi:helix-turn-helix transcriptional regulator [Halomarina litorea]|uniref:helix-turn-helix transcriptional regulator n=1 Tax=Halomarina litorea TaxID=2961595 RepID=UPI0020C2B023|nr:helix-turn-helix domain-containing protein [Halomarina sp. BCD28]